MSEGNEGYPESFKFGDITFQKVISEDRIDKSDTSEETIDRLSIIDSLSFLEDAYYDDFPEDFLSTDIILYESIGTGQKYSASYDPNSNMLWIIKESTEESAVNISDDLYFNHENGGFITIEVEGIGTFYKIHNENRYITPEGIYEIKNIKNTNATATLVIRLDSEIYELKIKYPVSVNKEAEKLYFEIQDGKYVDYLGNEMEQTPDLTTQEQQPNTNIENSAANQIVRFNRREDGEGLLGLS